MNGPLCQGVRCSFESTQDFHLCPMHAHTARAALAAHPSSGHGGEG